MKDLTNYELRAIGADGTVSRKYMVFPASEVSQAGVAANYDQMTAIVREPFAEGLFAEYSVTERCFNDRKGAREDMEGWRLVLSYEDRDLSNEFYPFGIKDADIRNAERIADCIMQNLKAEPGIEWDGKPATLERLKQEFEPDYDVTLSGDDVIVSFTKSQIYSPGEIVPDDQPAGK